MISLRRFRNKQNPPVQTKLSAGDKSCDNDDMDYYEELVRQIEDLIAKGDREEAKRLILNELSLPYVPRDTENRLNELLRSLGNSSPQQNLLTMEQIEEYLYLDDYHQLLAIAQLEDKNLRSCIDLCGRYLQSDGNANAKAYLIYCLILQEVDSQLILKRDGKQLHFNPAKLIPPEESEGYGTCLSILRESFLKDPSKLKLAEELLYKEAMLALPVLLNGEEGKYLAGKITEYIDKAFQ